MSTKNGKYQPVGVGMTPSKTELGNFIRTRRLELGISQVSLAEKIGLAQGYISALEIGKFNSRNGQKLEQLAKELQCDVSELLKRIPIAQLAQPKTELGKLIRSRREELNLTLEDFAKRIGVTHRKAWLLEIRKNPGIRYGLVKLLADALELSPSVFAQFAVWMKRETDSELGKLVRMRRKELGMSLSTLAERLNVSKQFVNQIEFGQCSLSENDEMIKRLAQILELDIKELEVVRPTRRLKQLKQMDNTNPLGRFLAARRLGLHLSQRQVSERAYTHQSIISSIERGRLRPSSKLLDKLAKILDCQILPELIPLSCNRSRDYKGQGYKTAVLLYSQDISDIEKIKEVSGINKNSEAVRKSVKLVRGLLEKQSDGYVIYLRKGEDTIKLEFLF